MQGRPWVGSSESVADAEPPAKVDKAIAAHKKGAIGDIDIASKIIEVKVRRACSVPGMQFVVVQRDMKAGGIANIDNAVHGTADIASPEHVQDDSWGRGL